MSFDVLDWGSWISLVLVVGFTSISNVCISCLCSLPFGLRVPSVYHGLLYSCSCVCVLLYCGRFSLQCVIGHFYPVGYAMERIAFRRVVRPWVLACSLVVCVLVYFKVVILC